MLTIVWIPGVAVDDRDLDDGGGFDGRLSSHAIGLVYLVWW